MEEKTFSKVSLSLSITHTLSVTHTHTHSLSHFHLSLSFSFSFVLFRDRKDRSLKFSFFRLCVCVCVCVDAYLCELVHELAFALVAPLCTEMEGAQADIREREREGGTESVLSFTQCVRASGDST
jgi:hypothetical protein